MRPASKHPGGDVVARGETPARGSAAAGTARELLVMSAVELAARIRRRELSSREVVEAHIDRIEAVNGALNAVVGEAFARAHAEARRADERIAARRADESLPPLCGVPCTIKESRAIGGRVGFAGRPRSALGPPRGRASRRLSR